MPQGIVAALFVVHGLITLGSGLGPLSNPATAAAGPGVPGTSWPFWPVALGRSWIFDAFHLGTGAAFTGGLVWTAAGLALLGAGLGLFGVPALQRVWQPLAVAGGGISLVAIGLYLHPWYLIALGVNLAVVATQAGTRGPITVVAA